MCINVDSCNFAIYLIVSNRCVWRLTECMYSSVGKNNKRHAPRVMLGVKIRVKQFKTDLF